VPKGKEWEEGRSKQGGGKSVASLEIFYFETIIWEANIFAVF
jgi:hypothetical protein